MKLTLIIASILAISAGNVFAQSSQSGSQAQARAEVFSQSASTGVAYNGGTTINQNGASRVKTKSEVRNVPNATAPGVITAHNCALGAGVGGSGVGWGISYGQSYPDENCVLINEAAALNTLVGANAAVLHLARDPEMCETLRSAGKISGNSLCNDEERRAAKRSARPAARASEVASVPAAKARPDTRKFGYTRCEPIGGKIHITYVRNLDANGKAAALNNCKLSLR